MLKIKLARFGKRNQPHYRIVVNTDRDKRDGKYVALLGHYAPVQSPKLLEIDVAEYKSWLKKGAQPTDTVAALFKRYESGNPFPPKKAQLSRKAKAKLEKPKEEVVAEAPAEPVAEPVVEATPEPVAESAPEPVAEATPAEETKPEESAPAAE